MRTGGTRGGGRLPIVLGGKWSDEKKENREGDGASDFDGSAEWQDATTNRKSAASLEYIWERLARMAKTIWEDAFTAFRPSDYGAKNK